MKRVFATLLPALFSLAALAQPRLPAGYFWQKLPNGLEVLVIENKKVPLVTIEMAVRNGAFTEGPEYSGLSHLFEHMFFKANRDYPDQETLLKRIKELGMVFNGTTGDERVNYFFTLDRDSLAPGLRFMNAAIRYPIYRPEDMQKERPVVDGEFQRSESNPVHVLYFAIQQKLWGDLLTRKNPIGDHQIINTATPEKMMIIKNKYYFPNNSLLVICGDVTHENGFALAKKIFGDWAPSDFDPFQKYPIPEFKPVAATEYFVKEASIAQTPYEIFAWQGPDTRNDSAGTVAADVFFTILSMNSSRWQQALVDKGLASTAAISYETHRYVGQIAALLIPNPEKLKECRDSVLAQLKAWTEPGYYTDEQLADAKEILRRNKLRSIERPSSLSSQATYDWCSASLDYETDYLDNCLKVTRADIDRFIATYIKDKPYIAGMVISPEMNKATQASEIFKP